VLGTCSTASLVRNQQQSKTNSSSFLLVCFVFPSDWNWRQLRRDWPHVHGPARQEGAALRMRPPRMSRDLCKVAFRVCLDGVLFDVSLGLLQFCCVVLFLMFLAVF
jgi:hypothetical protein